MKTQKGFASLIGIIIVVLIIGGGVYFYTSNTTQVDENSGLISPGDNNFETENSIEKENYYEIPEFNIKFKIPNELSGLTYQNDDNVVWFSLKELNDLPDDFENGCSGKRGTLGAVGLGDRNDIEEDEYLSGRIIAKNENTAVYYLGPHDPCSMDKDIQEIQSRGLKLINEALITIEFID